MKLRLLALGFVFLPMAGGIAFGQDAALDAVKKGAEAVVIVPMARSTEFPTHAYPGNAADLSFEGPFAGALKSLLESGIPDPGGLPYQKISIVVGDSLGGREVKETEGWVLPATGDGVSYAIAWNGLIYPLVRPPANADFEKTVAAFLVNEPVPGGSPSGEAAEVMPDQAIFFHGLYLTRFGKTDAATAVLKRLDRLWRTSAPVLANEWLRSLHNRAVCAYLRGDARMALASLYELERMKPFLSKPATVSKAKAPVKAKAITKTKKKAKALAKTPADEEDEADETPVAVTTSDFSALKAECERMIREGKTGPFDTRTFLGTHPGVPALVDALDRVTLPRNGSRPEIFFTSSPLVWALVEKGDEAVEPLLDCLANDRRLTRTVNPWQSALSRGPQGHTLLGVHMVALAALGQILDMEVDILNAGSDKARATAAQTLRARWMKYGRATGMERAYRVLNDDTASTSAYIRAAGTLFPADPFAREGKKETAAPLPGEVLRDRSTPSVSDLLEKRILEGSKNYDREIFRCQMLIYLLGWDPSRGRAGIARQVDDWIARESWKSSVFLLKQFIDITAADSADSLRLFEKMAWGLGPDQYQDLYTGETVTRMLAIHGDSPGLKRSRDGLWTDPQSPWCLAKLGRADLESLLREWRKQGVTGTEPFKAALAGLLTNQVECASINLDPRRLTDWQMKDGGKVSFSRPVPNDPDFALKPGEIIFVRRADVAAKVLSEADAGQEGHGLPPMEYWWPMEAREARIAGVTKELMRK